ncbi:hypothetical protein FSP39_005201 [Pinctada imbricata]|uniref:Uncharacterized protein n=1 Tax=Pinctada imbricata TaxID=66713 RepID=A0AA88YB08_PINIB|nr:hypothetical protein FSP39_005201 [Pinctada imbricata]
MDSKSWIVLLLLLAVSSATKSQESQDKGSSEVDTATLRTPPGLKAPKKLWWLKEITPEYHMAGRLSERQIKYIADGGFKSVISLFEDNEPDDLGGERLPTNDEAREVAKISGLQYAVVLDESDDWASVKAVEKLAKVLKTVNTPAVLHCNRGYTITFVTLMHMANLTRHDPKYTPRITSKNFYKITAAMGLDFTMDFTKAVVAEITGEPIVENPPKPDANPEEWYDYWLAHSVYKNWYTAGQISVSHLPIIKMAGFKSVVNMRQGVTMDGNPSQEAVTLLNVKDGTATYGDDKIGPRQIPFVLESLRTDPNRGNKYVSADSETNYEVTNPKEFGDEIGYSEELEKEIFEKDGMPYYHMPVATDGTYSPELFGKYKDQLLELGKKGPVLVHCASAKRVAYMSVLAAALQYDKDMRWALKRLRELGFEVSSTKKKDIYNMYQAWLDKENYNRTDKDEL